jgi:hypothetical protein
MKTSKAVILLLALILIILPIEAQTNNLGNSLSPGRLGYNLNKEIKDWFRQYDLVRRQSKMTFREKLQSRHLLTLYFNPMALFSEDSEDILKMMIDKYSVAIAGMEKLPHLLETEELRSGFLKYFTDARQLFNDSLETKEKDLTESDRYLAEILQRKKQLEILDQKNKDLDRHLRAAYHIPPLSQEFFK